MCYIVHRDEYITFAYLDNDFYLDMLDIRLFSDLSPK